MFHGFKGNSMKILKIIKKIWINKTFFTLKWPPNQKSPFKN